MVGRSYQGFVVALAFTSLVSTTALSNPLQMSTLPDPNPAAGIATAPLPDDNSVAGRLRAFLGEDAIARHIPRKDDRAAVETFYRERGYAPLWLDNRGPNERARAAMTYLRGVAADGLEPADYPAPAFAATTPEAQAEDELKLTNSVITYARHARTGRVNFTRVSSSILYQLEFPNPADVLAKLAESSNVRATLDGYQPQHAGYKALKAKLAELRSGNAPAVQVAAEPEPQAKGRKSKRKQAQATAAGRHDNRDNRVGAVIANMERWRWLPRDLGAAHVVVNIPDYSLRVMNNNKTAWATRIVVGKPGENATPIFTETMKFITVNPTWNVPPSIVQKEYLPALARDPGALARMGLEVRRKRDGTIHISQPPGPRNALGRIRFNFPNQFLVYQHDTPTKHLFANAERAYSHGCMRVQHPETYAEVLLSITQPGERMTADRIRSLYGTSERTINLKTPLPVHVTYQTAFVDESGHLQLRRDVYGRDAALLRVLRDERAVADLPLSRNLSAAARASMARYSGR